METYDAEAVANYFLDKAGAENKDLSAMKLQKLIFFAHGWHLALAKKPLINEIVEAWKYGPVIPSIYHEFKRYGRQPIQGYGSVIKFDKDGSGGIEGLRIVTPKIPSDAEHKPIRDLLDRIWEVYGDFTAGQLSNLTHVKGSPWEETVSSQKEEIRNLQIPNNRIQKYFAQKAKGN